MHSLKILHPHVKEVASGTVSLLSGGEMQPSTKVGSIVKPALICYAGTFDGMYGEVTVTEEILAGLADRYNREKENPQNENAYAPILTDHVREVDRVKGRLLCGLSVQPWTNPSTGETTAGLYGSLRIDDQDAQKKVDDGSYAHVSISFDEETFELFEISFVAVEAARGAMVLSQKNSQGGKMELSKKFASLSQKHKALAADVKLQREKRQVSLKKIKATEKDVMKTMTALSTRLVDLKANLVQKQQSSLTAIPDTAGVMTTRGFGAEYLADGTNRRAIRFTLVNFMCNDMEQMMDNTRSDFHVRRDVTRGNVTGP